MECFFNLLVVGWFVGWFVDLWNSGRCVAFKDSVVEILSSNWKILVEFESGLLIVEFSLQLWSHIKKLGCELLLGLLGHLDHLNRVTVDSRRLT